MKKKLTEDQKIQIKAAFLAGCGEPELADRVVGWISDIVDDGQIRRPINPGRPELSSNQIDGTIREIRNIQSRNRHLQSDRSIARALKIDRRRVKKAKRIMRQRIAIRWFQVFGRRKNLPPAKTVLHR